MNLILCKEKNPYIEQYKISRTGFLFQFRIVNSFSPHSRNVKVNKNKVKARQKLEKKNIRHSNSGIGRTASLS